MGNRHGNKRFNFTLGAGSARVALPSFQGDIHVAKSALRNREQEREDARSRKRGAVRQREELEPEWQREIERLRDWASAFIAPMAPEAPAPPPAPPAPHASRARRPPR